MRLELVEPGLQRQDGLASEAEDAQARITRDAFVRDQACLEQDSQVSAHDGSRGPSGLGQLTGTMGPVGEKLDHPLPGRIRKGGEELLQIVVQLRNS